MTGNDMPLIKFIDSSMMQLIIPVYQRNYDWKTENCNQLFNDLVKLKQSQRKSHFFGSIVSAPAGSGSDRLIIDGQQRLTTTSLLLQAGIKAAQDQKLKVSNPSLIDLVRDTFLMAKYCSNPSYTYKIRPIEKDCEALVRVYAGEEAKMCEHSNITRNYRYFYSRLTEGIPPFTFDELYEAIAKLHIIHISLGDDDDPQLIFESLNSTGLALEEADKIRNYLLMSLPAQEQEECHRLFWQKIEEATANEPTMFLRDYITIRTHRQRPVKLNHLYTEWKRYMQDHQRREELELMTLYSHYYQQITTGTILLNGKPNERLSKKMRQLCNLDTDILNVYLIPFLKHADDTHMDEELIWQVLNLIETYIARRIVCGLPSNTLTQVFSVLHRDAMKSLEEYAAAGLPLQSDYADILAYHILRRDGNARLPRDNQFRADIATRDVYHMIKPQQRFLFERLENFQSKEFIDVAEELRSKEATLEHIMPQTLTPEWRHMLGNQADDIHERYLHTFANLTLTGINSELSNHPFEEKKRGTIGNGLTVNGYHDSKYRLTQEISQYSSWTEADLKQRTTTIESKLLTLYPLPTSSFKPMQKPFEDISLDDEAFSPTNRLLRGYRLFNEEHIQSVWVNFYIEVVQKLMQLHPDQMEALRDKDYWLHYEPSGDAANYACLQDHYFLFKAMDNRSKLSALKYFFENLNIELSELTLLLEPLKGD